jgi:hypothetical protein
MAFDTDKLRSHLKESGLFSDAEIEAEVLSAQKDAKAEERRTILNTQKVEAPVVAQSSPAIAAAPAAAVAAPVPAAAVPSVAQPITSATTPAQLFDMRPKGTPVERIGANINEAAAAAGPAAANVASNATQDSLNYARDAIANNPELTGALAAIPVLYGANKLGLFDNLGSKMSASSAQPQPFVGGAGPRNTPPAPSTASPIQNWDIHNEPALFAPTPAAAPAATTAPAAPVNTKLQELQARAAAGMPTSAAPAAPIVPAATAPVPPVMSERQSAIAEADARLAAVRNSPEVQNSIWGSLSSNETPAEADARKSIGQAKLAAAVEAHRQEVSAAYKLSEAPAIQEIGPPEFTGPRRPVVPTPPAALAATTAPVTPAPVPPTGYNKRVTEAMAGVPQSVQEKYAKEGKTVLKGYGAGDRNLTNTYGPEAYATIVDHFNNGKPIGSYENYLEVQKKINQGIPSSLAPEFAAKLPGSEAEAGNFATKFGDTGAYTKEGKVVTSPSAIKKAVAGGGALFLATTMPAKAGALTTTAALTALPALGEAAYNKYKGNEAAVTASLQDAKNALKSLVTMPYDVSKAALQGDLGPFKDLMMSMNPGSLLFNEMDKHDEAIIKKMIQKEKTGAGRGLQGVAPPAR